MLLSTVAKRFMLQPFNSSTLADHNIDPDWKVGDMVVITWNDTDTMHSHRQVFHDQDVGILPIGEEGPGAFTVARDDGEVVGFFALEYVELEDC